MLKKSFVSLSLILSAFAVSVPAQAGWDFLDVTKIPQAIKKQVAKQRIGGSIDLVDAEIFDGLSSALKYKIESEPSYVDGYYTRLDRYTLNIDVTPGDLLDDNDSPIGFGIHKENEVIFARQFKSQKDSLLAAPYTFKNIPLTAHKAINNMNVGDFVALEGDLSVTLSIGASNLLAKYVELSGSTHVYISGNFYIHLFKMADNKLRVKLISVRGKGVGAEGKVEIGDGLEIIGFSYIDKKIKRIVNTKPISVEVGSNKSDLFMLDYVFDLDNAVSAQAYDDFMGKKSRFKEVALINPFENRSKMEKDLMTDLRDIEEISYADRELPQQERRIDRIFKGSNSAVVVSSKFKFGINLLRFEAESAYAQNRVSYENRNREEKKFLLDTYVNTKKTKMLFGMFGDETRNGSNLLFTADDNWKAGDFVALVVTKEIKMKNVTADDYKKMKSFVRNLIPADQFAKIDWKDWNLKKNSKINGYFRSEMFFRPEAMASIRNMSQKEVYTRVATYMEKTGPSSVLPGYARSIIDMIKRRPWLSRYESNLQELSRDLTLVLNKTSPSTTRYEAFKRLRNMALWQERGIGFLLSLLPSGNPEQLIAYTMTFTAKDAQAINFRYGGFAEEELYRSLMYIQNVLNDRSFDLRLVSEAPKANGQMPEFTLQ